MKRLILASALVFMSSSAYSSNINKESYHRVSWYRTGSSRYTAAHRTLPFGTVLTLYNPANGKKIKAVVNDRGPFIRSRSVDVSRSAAIALGFLDRGIATLVVSAERP